MYAVILKTIEWKAVRDKIFVKARSEILQALQIIPLEESRYRRIEESNSITLQS